MSKKTKKLTDNEMAKMFEEYIDRAASEFFELDKIKERSPENFFKDSFLSSYTLCKTISPIDDSEYIMIGYRRIKVVKTETAKRYARLPSNIQLL